MDYLLIAETKDNPVYIVVEIISLQGVIRSQIVRLGKLFYVSMEGVLSVWTVGTSQKIVRLKICPKDVRRVNIIFRYVRLPLGKRNGSNNDKEGGNNTTDKDNSSFTGHTRCENKGKLLQTALADICSAHTSEVKHYTRLLFDSGRQRSYISAKARDTLQLKTTDRKGDH